jgi:hypothetical protein
MRQLSRTLMQPLAGVGTPSPTNHDTLTEASIMPTKKMLRPRMLAGLLAALCCPTLAGEASFAPTSPAALLTHCADDAPAAQRFCQGYLSAAADASPACIPSGISFTTIKDLAVSALRGLADDAGGATADVLGQRLAAAFPCQREPQPAAADSGDAPLEAATNRSNKERFGK